MHAEYCVCACFVSPLLNYPSREEYCLVFSECNLEKSKGVTCKKCDAVSFMSLHFTVFQNCLSETGLSMPSDTSLSPASQNSPYCMTPVSQGSPASSGIGSPMASSAITKIHSKRFRE